MAYRVTYSNDEEAGTVSTPTLKEAQKRAKELKDKGFRGIIIFDDETQKAVEAY